MLEETSCKTLANSVASSRFLLRLLREILHICDMLLLVLLCGAPATTKHLLPPWKLDYCYISTPYQLLCVNPAKFRC
jgi:hypothetical protein